MSDARSRDRVAVDIPPLHDVRILLLEVGGSHSEVLLSWYRDLRALGAHVYVACPANMWKHLDLTDAAGWLETGGQSGLNGHISTMLGVRRFVKTMNITHVILNTATGTKVRDIALFLPKRCTVVGTLHNAEKLIRSFNQSVTTRNVDVYAVLGPHVADAIPPSCTVPVVVVPATAPDAQYAERARDKSRFSAEASSKPLRVVIAGGINWRRRDYDSLFAQNGFERIGDNVQIVLAGGPDEEDKPRLKAMLDMARRDMFELHDGFIPHDTYARIISESDIVLPLTHPSSRDYDRYVQYQITGAMSNAWAYAKPLMLERGFAKHTSLASSIFYDVAALPDLIRRFAEDRTLLIPYAVTPDFASDAVRQAAIVGVMRQ